MQRLRGRVFMVATALVLAGVAAAIVVPTLIHHNEKNPRLGVVGTLSATDKAAVVSGAHGVGITIDFVAEPDEATATSALKSGDLDASVVNGRSVVVNKAADTTSILTRVVASAIGESRAMTAADLTPAQLIALGKAGPLPVRSLSTATVSNAQVGTAVACLIVMFVLLGQYLSWTLMGVTEEKASRVVEVLLGTLRPLQLLAGKLLGTATVVFAQATLVGVVAFVLARATGSEIFSGAAPLTLGAFVLWLVLGYALYSWVYAAAGSMVERQDQVQSLVLPLMLPLLVGYVSSVVVVPSGKPNLLLHVLAYLPPTAPFAMPSLVALGDATWWQFALSVLLTVATIVFVAYFAAAVYQRSILRTGGRVHLRDVLRAGGR